MQKRKPLSTSTLGELLRAARKSQRLTFREVASSSATSHGFIADLEMGRRMATDDVLERLAKALGLDAKILLRASAAERIEGLEARIEEIKRGLR